MLRPHLEAGKVSIPVVEHKPISHNWGTDDDFLRRTIKSQCNSAYLTEHVFVFASSLMKGFLSLSWILCEVFFAFHDYFLFIS